MKATLTLIRTIALLAMVVLTTGFLSAQTTVTVNPPTTSVLRGATFTLDVNISGATNVLASHVQLTFDNTKLQFNSATAGGFMPGGSFFDANASGGTLTVDQSVLANPPAAGGGTLFTVSFTALDAVDAGAVGVTVDLRNPMNQTIPATPTGGQVTVNNPLPHVTSIDPATKTAGDAEFMLTVNGSNFVPTSVVWFKGAAHATSYTNGGVLTATILASDLTAAGDFPLTVVNPAPGGGTSTEVVNLTVSPAALDHFDIAPIGTQTAGMAFSITLTALDAYGNTVPSFVGTVALSTTAGLITPATSGTFVLGTLTQSVSVTQSGAGKTISVNDGSSHTGLSNVFDVNPGSVDHFDIANIGTQSAGIAFDITITAKDLNNNIASGFVGTVSLSTTAGTITPTTSGAFALGALTQSLTVTQSGTGKAITVNDGSSHTGVSNLFDVNPGAVDHFAIAPIGTQTAGTAFDVTITAQDANNNSATEFVGTVNLLTTAGTITPATSGTFTLGVLTQSVTVTQSGAGKTISVNDGSAHTGASNAFDVNPGSVTHFVIDPIGTQTAGAAFSITITALDANNNTAAGFSGTVNLSTTAGVIIPAISGTFTLGALTQSVSVSQAGTGKTITADDGAGHSGISNTFDVNAGGVDHFSIATIGAQTAGVAFNITITALDANNNPATGFAGTVNLSTTAGTISPTTSGTFTLGALTQSVSVTLTGTGKTISVNDGSSHTGESNAFDVNPGSVTHFAIDPIGTQTAGIAFNITITALDANNNPATGFAGSVNLSTTAGTISPITSGTFTLGALTQSVSLTLAGTGKTISVNDGSSHTGVSTAFDVNPGNVTQFIIDLIGTQTAGVAFNITITAQDANNNTATGFVGTVNLATTAGTIAPTVSGSFSLGVLTQSVTVSQSGTGKTISVDDGALHTGISGPFDVNAGGVDHFVIATIGTQSVGSTFDITITGLDAQGNTASGFSGTVVLTVNAGTITPTTSGSFAAGILAQSVTLTVAGSGRTITADDGATHTGTSNTFDVLAMPNLFVSADPAVAAPGVVFPNTSWTTTAYEPNDWSFLGSPVLSVYIVPEPGMTFNSSTVTLNWDATVVSFSGVNFGAQGSPNGLFGSGQSYVHTESSNQSLGANTVTIIGARTDGDFSAVAGDYIARVDFTLLKPGYSDVNVQSASFLRMPSNQVQVATHAGKVRAYLGDVASGPPPAAEPVSGTIGDGQVDFQDLVVWSGSYWSGVSGYSGGLANYKVKDDFGPTENGSVYSLPVPDLKIDFEDLIIFSISYGLSSSGLLPKGVAVQKEPVEVSLGQAVVSGSETRIPIKIGGTVSDVRAMRFELTGQFVSFLGAEKGSLLNEYGSSVAVMSRSEEGKAFVDLAVLGGNVQALNREGEVVVLRFQGTPHVQLVRHDARNSENLTLPVQKVSGAGEGLPTMYGLRQNYPNPFNPATTIAYEVPSAGIVSIEIYNMLGQRVTTLVNEVKEPGFYQVKWNGRDDNQQTVASGVFFYRLQAGDFSEVKRMILLK